MPFAYHIRQPEPTTPPSASFHQFSRLPPELQLMIIHWCDKPTLFQLMLTSRFTRTEARKAFFSDPDAWYCIDTDWTQRDWLFEGGHPGDTCWNMDFLAFVERLYINLGQMTVSHWMNQKWSGTEEEAVAGAFGLMNENIQTFWGIVRHVFPRLKHVIIGDGWPRMDDDKNRPVVLPTAMYTKVGQMCPPGINISISLARRERYATRLVKRIRWRPVVTRTDANTKLKWEERANPSEPQIYPPYKTFRGPVGRAQDLLARRHIRKQRNETQRTHHIAAIEKFHFDGRHEPFGCSFRECPAFFNEPEEYTNHAMHMLHYERDMLLIPFKALFSEHEKRWEKLKDIEDEKMEAIFAWWGKEGSEKRKNAILEVENQFIHDPWCFLIQLRGIIKSKLRTMQSTLCRPTKKA